MKLWQLEGELQQVKPFESPNIKLEQYLTTPHLAAHTLYTATLQGDIEDKIVLDLGTGTGMLAIASALCGASHVIGVDIDEGALSIAQQNLDQCQVNESVDLIHANVFDLGTSINRSSSSSSNSSNSSSSSSSSNSSSSKGDKGVFMGCVDTVVLNPPFGTRMKGADMHFLSVAVRLTKTAVYSLHKSSTRDYILRVADSWGCKAKVVAELVYDLPATYSFHKKPNQQIQVDLIRLEKRASFNPANMSMDGSPSVVEKKKSTKSSSGKPLLKKKPAAAVGPSATKKKPTRIK